MVRETSSTRHDKRSVSATTTGILKNAIGPDQEIERKGSASASEAGRGTSERDDIRMRAAWIEAEIMTAIEMVMQMKGVIVKEREAETDIDQEKVSSHFTSLSPSHSIQRLIVQCAQKKRNHVALNALERTHAHAQDLQSAKSPLEHVYAHLSGPQNLPTPSRYYPISTPNLSNPMQLRPLARDHRTL